MTHTTATASIQRRGADRPRTLAAVLVNIEVDDAVTRSRRNQLMLLFYFVFAPLAARSFHPPEAHTGVLIRSNSA